MVGPIEIGAVDSFYQSQSIEELCKLLDKDGYVARSDAHSNVTLSESSLCLEDCFSNPVDCNSKVVVYRYPVPIIRAPGRDIHKQPIPSFLPSSI